MPKTKLDHNELKSALGKLDGWMLRSDGGAIEKKFKFADFAEAFSFMTQMAITAEKMNHHPEWSNVYNRVEVALTTHDSNGVTGLDIELAAAMNKAC